jgi:hypothetical protein
MLIGSFACMFLLVRMDVEGHQIYIETTQNSGGRLVSWHFVQLIELNVYCFSLTLLSWAGVAVCCISLLLETQNVGIIISVTVRSLWPWWKPSPTSLLFRMWNWAFTGHGGMETLADLHRLAVSRLPKLVPSCAATCKILLVSILGNFQLPCLLLSISI